MSVSSQLSLGWGYVNCTTDSLYAKEFEELLSEDVKLEHETNNEAPVKAEGREEVVELFQKYIFSNSSHIEVKKANILYKDGLVEVKLTVVEDKTEGEKVTRYKFKEKTLLEVNDGVITNIFTTVKRRLATS